MPDAVALPEVLSLEEAADRLRLASARDLKYLVRKGQIRCYRGRRGLLTFSPHHLAEYLQSIEGPRRKAAAG